jgi:hypothetical protein
MGDLIGDADTTNGWYPYRPECRYLHQDLAALFVHCPGHFAVVAHIEH